MSLFMRNVRKIEIVNFDPSMHTRWPRVSRSVVLLLRGPSTRLVRVPRCTTHSYSYPVAFRPWTLSWVRASDQILLCLSDFVLVCYVYTPGGGLAVGTVLLIGKHKVIDVLNFELSLTTAEEDVFASYSRLLLKMFLAEGVMCGHAVYLASASEDPTELLGVRNSTLLIEKS